MARQWCRPIYPNVCRSWSHALFPQSLDWAAKSGLYATYPEFYCHTQLGPVCCRTKKQGEFIGFIGLHQHLEHYDFAPCIEIGWRLAKQYWHNGYATEGAKAILDYAFRELQLDNVVSFTTVLNAPSEKVMQKIGLSKVKTFAHPLVPADHPLLNACALSDWSPKLSASALKISSLDENCGLKEIILIKIYHPSHLRYIYFYDLDWIIFYINIYKIFS